MSRMLLGLFKKKEIQTDEELENMKMIAVPDIRSYMLKGYEEIKEIKDEKEELEQKIKEYKEQADKFEQLYNAQLVVSQEFEQRYNTAESKRKFLVSKYESEQDLRKLDNKESKQEIDRLKEQNYILQEKLEDTKTIISKEIKEELINKVQALKGNLSKSKIINLIEEESKS